jgi:hypothetical protein
MAAPQNRCGLGLISVENAHKGSGNMLSGTLAPNISHFLFVPEISGKQGTGRSASERIGFRRQPLSLKLLSLGTTL